MPPAGYKRSRALWDDTRRPDASLFTYLRAIMYELQPIRFSRANQRQFVSFLRNVFATCINLLRSIPPVTMAIFRFSRNLKLKHWLMLLIVVIYYYFVRFMHDFLEAGPLVIIVTALSLIFTIGLSDDGNRDGLSAYAVFNRGFERLLGSVDAEALMAQHVGGGLGGGGAGMMGAAPHDGEEQLGGRGAGRRRRQNRPREAVDPINNGEDENEQANNQNRARKSGKKARRRNLEQRREIQNQREAAAALGNQFGNGEAMEEEVAMQRLIEEQIAAENR